MDSFYRDTDPDLCQGDIVKNIPHLFLKPPVQVLRKTSSKANRLMFEAFKVDSEDVLPGGFNVAGENVSAHCQAARGIVLTHGCEIDKDEKHRLVALIRPLVKVKEQDQQTIRENKNRRFFYLEKYQDVLPESYVDFRRLSTVDPKLINMSERITSLDEKTVLALQAQFIRFITRRILTDEFD